jgi:hypothetical protein
MTIEEMQEEKKNLLRAINRRNADLRRFKDERNYYKHQADSDERWYQQLETALKIACETIPKELLRSGSPVLEPGVMMALAAKQLREKDPV